MVFVCHKTVSIAAVYQLKIKYDQDNFGLVFVHAKRLISFPLEDKHVVNELHVFLSSYRNTSGSLGERKRFSIEFENKCVWNIENVRFCCCCCCCCCCC